MSFHISRSKPFAILFFVLLCAAGAFAFARGGGGGGRAGGGGGGARVGGGGGSVARPSMGGGVSRPAGNISRPVSIPSARPAPSRPSFSQAAQPAARPSTPAQRPTMGVSSPSVNRPAARPSNIERPTMADSRPSLGSAGVTARPVIADRTPSGPSNARPGIANRPTPLPGAPGGGAKPERPVIGGGNKPTPPGQGERPVIGGGPRPTPPPNHGGWAGHPIPPPHNGWYHGCWNGHWGNFWYAPIVAGATFWGLSAIMPAWGYESAVTYSNPYYVQSDAETFDYSQPLAIDASEASDDQGEAADPATSVSPENSEAYKLFDQARAAFKSDDFTQAYAFSRQAIQKEPNDPLLHEFNAVCLFTLGDYKRSAAVLNNVLAVSPGMDWTSFIGLFSSLDEYTKHLRKLEAYCKANPNDGAAYFVVSYLYLVGGYSEEATKALKVVTAKQSNDATAQQLLAALSAAEKSTAEDEASSESEADSEKPQPKTDLVGAWRAEKNGDRFELTFDDVGGFIWKATPKNKKAVAISGRVTITDSLLILDGKDQGRMIGEVTSVNPDEFQFTPPGSAPNDKGLAFKRTNNVTPK